MSLSSWIDIIAAFLEWLTGDLFADLRMRAEKIAKEEADSAPVLAKLRADGDAAEKRAKDVQEWAMTAGDDELLKLAKEVSESKEDAFRALAKSFR